ncbi:MAG: FAD-dependent oxidoreductase [Hyphomicrobiaceae bacterium]
MHKRKSIAVIGSGISGLSAAWLLSRAHDVTLFESDGRLGGHSNTFEAAGCPVDTGFIVFNPVSYPNLVALFDHLGVPTQDAPMGFSVSLDGGKAEYSGASVGTLIGHTRNLASADHWRMMIDLVRFLRQGPHWARTMADETVTLATFLKQKGFSDAFSRRHILPMAAAIWSTPSDEVMNFPAAAFFRFFANHGLLEVRQRPQWQTVTGGSRVYVQKLLRDFRGSVRAASPVQAITRHAGRVDVHSGEMTSPFDACVIATHADQALRLLTDPSAEERRLLGAFAYAENRAVLHRDPTLMPRRRHLWSSWNYLAAPNVAGRERLSVTYWMSELQSLGDRQLFVTLNPTRPVRQEAIIAAFDYAHPIFDRNAMTAQKQLWSLQGQRNTWLCGSYFGYGFHEDGLQAGLAVAEQLGGVTRPWAIESGSSRIHVRPVERAMELA